jgi:hypothetical protein
MSNLPFRRLFRSFPATARARRALFVTALLAVLGAGLCGCTTTPPAHAPAAGYGTSAAPETPPLLMSRSKPVRVHIPAIAADAELIDLGLRGDGTMEVPPDGVQAGWYTGAPTPGEMGPAIIAGHVDWHGKPGVFNRLIDLHPGDQIDVTREDGSTATFRVSRLDQYPKNAFATAAVYGDIDHAGLRLITCGGSFDAKSRSYADNIVVFAELVGDRPGGTTR